MRKIFSFRELFPEKGAGASLDHKISEMELLLKQMLPSDYDFRNPEGVEKTFQHLQKLIEYRREGLLNDVEFSAIKRRLLPFLQE